MSRRLGGAADRDRQTRMKRSGKDERPSARPNHAQAGSGWRETKWPRSENSTGEWPDHRSSRFQRPRVRAWPHGWAGSPFHARECAMRPCAMWRCVQPGGARQMGAQIRRIAQNGGQRQAKTDKKGNEFLALHTYWIPCQYTMGFSGTIHACWGGILPQPGQKHRAPLFPRVPKPQRLFMAKILGDWPKPARQ